MSSLRDELESLGLVLPTYKKSNLEVARQLSEGKGDLIGERDKKIFMILDGFGYNIFDRIINKERIHSDLLKDARIEKVTTVFPSTTPTVLASLYSGIEPSGHGILGTMMMLKEIGSVKKIFGWSPAMSEYLRVRFDSLDPHITFPKPYLLDKVKSSKKTVFLYPEMLINSEVTNAMLGHENKIPYVSFDDMLVRLVRLMKEDTYEYIYVYYDTTDHMQHVYSPDSDEFRESIYRMLHSFDRILTAHLKGSDYNLIITADHGHITIKNTDIIHMNYRSKIMNYLSAPPWNESRLRILTVMSGKEAELEDHFDKTYKDSGYLVRSDEAIKAGLFGAEKVDDFLRSRFGTYMIVPKGSRYFEYDYPDTDKKPREKFGHHGSLSGDEMYIPVIIY